jgi:predicted transcriptional regulator
MLPDLTSIRTRRLKLGIALVDLSKATGVKPAMLSTIENGDVPNAGYEKVKAIFDYLDRAGKVQEGKRAGQVCTKKVIGVGQFETVEKARDLMMKHNISQLPVFHRTECIGLISEHGIMCYMLSHNIEKIRAAKVRDVMETPPPIIHPEYSISQEVAELLSHSKCILVSKDGKIEGIITPTDVIKKK